MSITFNCPKCGGRIQVSWLDPGQLARCLECGEQVEVPRESESTDDRSWNGIALAGLVPSAFMFLGLIPFIGNIVIVVAPLVANPLIGVIVGNRVSRLRFIQGMGVAIAAWILSSFVGAFGISVLFPLVGGYQPLGSQAGLGMFVGTTAIFGLVGTPLAGAAAQWGPHLE